MNKIFLPCLLMVAFNLTAQDESQPVVQTVKKEKVKAGFGVPVLQRSPEFPGGQEAMKTFLMDNIKYPEEAKTRKASGTVYVGFVVGKDGKIAEEKVLSSVDPALDAEALRVIHLMPDWSPGTAGGTPTDMQYILPFDFYFPESRKE